jgi:tRNA pseudouridine55 synthase
MTGILLLDKPAGMTSHDVVAKVRKVLATREVGHAGTLDPQATGLLVLAVGGATRWLPWLLASKTYRTSLRLGLATDTEDVWGVPIAQDEAPAPGEAAWRGALEGLTRLTEQVPPMVSALKVGGRRLYELAREGRSVERAPRPVSITAVRVLAVRGQEADLDVDCGPGTYVRSLCVEAGRRLGRPACMTSLRRLRSGAFDVEQALPPERWAADGFWALTRPWRTCHARACCRPKPWMCPLAAAWPARRRRKAPGASIAGADCWRWLRPARAGACNPRRYSQPDAPDHPAP